MASAADRKRREERVKLAATALSKSGVATFVSAFLAPLLIGRLAPLSLVAVPIGLGLHLAAQRLLHYVADDPRQEAHPWIGR